MARIAFAAGRVLAAAGAMLLVATVLITVLAFRNADNCSEPDCDDSAREDAVQRARVMLPASVVVGAAGLVLTYASNQKVRN